MAKRTYETDELVIHWDSSRCIHSANCLRALPAVFDTDQRPWVQPEGSPDDEIVAAIELCPSGALGYEWKSGRDAPGEAQVTIMPSANGPLYVRGPVRIINRSGAVLAEGDRLTLCRCGASRNQPFCDLSHKDVGFRDNPAIVPEYRREADAPGDVDPA